MARTFFPVLKEAGWAHQALCVSFPLLGRSDTPIVCFAEDLPNGYSFLTRQEAPSLDASAFLGECVANLQARPTEVVGVAEGLVMTGGRDLSAERLLDPHYLSTLHPRLGPQIYVSVPHRVALYAASASAPEKSLDAFKRLVRFETQNGPSKGHAPVSSLVFCIENARIVGAITLDQAVHRPAPAQVAPALPPGVRLPNQLVRTNAATKEIEFSVVAVGSGAKAFGRTVHTMANGASTDPAKPHELEHFVMTLGKIREWTTRLFVYSLPPTSDVAAQLASAADAVLIVEDGPTPDPSLAAIARAAHARKAVVAFAGPPSCVATLETQSGVAPQVKSGMGSANAMQLLKDVSRPLLASLRS